MKNQLLLLSFMMASMMISAETIKVDGIYYEISSGSTEATVTVNPDKYAGDVVIPAKIIYGSTEYSVKYIGPSAFSGCYNLTSVVIPDSVMSISNEAFFGCRNMASLTIPKTVTYIGDFSFKYCTGLTSIEIPDSMTYIGDFAFQGCTGLTSFKIPNTLTALNSGLLSGCTSITSVTIPDKVTTIGDEVFAHCYALDSIAIPNSVTTMGDGVFKNCYALSKAVLPENYGWIKMSTFQNCQSLKSIKIPAAVKIIYENAFDGCDELNQVIVYAVNPPSAYANSFSRYGVTLHVPKASISSYVIAEPWSYFAKITNLPEEGGGGGEEKKPCATPTISYNKGHIQFHCETEDVNFNYNIINKDVASGIGSTVTLSATYTIEVYATKEGYKQSETATGTLCWIDAEPKTEGITDDIVKIPAKAVMIQTNGGTLNIQGVEDGTRIKVYGVSGSYQGSAVSSNGIAIIETSLQAGSVAIVMIGDTSIKLIMK